MNFFKGLFNKDKTPPRTLNSVNELNAGDIIVLTDSFALPEAIRGQQLEVTAVNSYEFEHKVDTEWVLASAQGTELYLTLEQDDTTELKIALKIESSDVEVLFDLDSFSEIFDELGNAELTRVSQPEHLDNWHSEQYFQTKFAQVGYFHRKDFRGEQTPDQYQGKDAGEQFELYSLTSQDDVKGIDIEVWSDGDTDVFLTLYRPLSDITDFFPGS